MVIDHVGSGHTRVCRLPPDHACETTIAYQTLKNCALVSSHWTRRSHKNLFRVIVFTVGTDERPQDLVLPSEESLKLVKFLDVNVAPESHHRAAITLRLLSAFSVCPLESLQIEQGLFPLVNRPALRTCFDALPSQLLDLTFRYCLFEPEPLRDVLAIQNTKANITFLCCDQDHPEDPARNNINWPLVNHSADRILCVMGGEEKPSEEFLIDLSELSVRVSQLDVDFYEDGEFPDATQCLINATAGLVTFLRVNVISSTFPSRI